MDLNDIFALMDRFDSSGITSLELDEGGTCLKLGKGAPVFSTAPAMPAAAAAPVPPAAPAAPKAPDQSGAYLRAPLVGTFYAAAAPDQPAFVAVGDTVKQGQTVCVLEAMKMMSEIPAPSDCVIEEILARDGELVGYDAPLFRIREVSSC